MASSSIDLNNFFKKTSEQHSAKSSCKTSLISDAFYLTVFKFFREFYKLTLNTCIYKPYLATTRGPMTIKAWPYIRTGSCEFVKKIRKFFGQGEKNIWGHGFSLQQLDETRRRIKKFYNYCSQSAAHKLS